MTTSYYSIIVNAVEYRSETPLTIHGNGTYSVQMADGRFVTSNSPIHASAVVR